METLVVCAVDFFQPAEECGVRACVRVKCVQKTIRESRAYKERFGWYKVGRRRWK